MRISRQNTILSSLLILALFPVLWAMAAESFHTDSPELLEYRRLDPPRLIQASRENSAPDATAARVVALSSDGMLVDNGPSQAPSPPFSHLTAFSLMSFGVVGLVAIRRRPQYNLPNLCFASKIFSVFWRNAQALFARFSPKKEASAGATQVKFSLCLSILVKSGSHFLNGKESWKIFHPFFEPAPPNDSDVFGSLESTP